MAARKSRTSLRIDRQKLEQAGRILGTGTIVETVDAALDEVLALDARRRLLRRIERDGGIGPTPEDLRQLREP